MTFLVSFNNEEYEIGGFEDEETVDYYGEDKDKVIEYVNNVDKDYLLTFQPYEGKNDNDGELVGFFVNDDGDETAILYISDYVNMPTEIK